MFKVDRENGLTLVEIWPGTSIHEIQVETGCEFSVSSKYALLYLYPNNPRKSKLVGENV